MYTHETASALQRIAVPIKRTQLRALRNAPNGEDTSDEARQVARQTASGFSTRHVALWQASRLHAIHDDECTATKTRLKGKSPGKWVKCGNLLRMGVLIP